MKPSSTGAVTSAFTPFAEIDTSASFAARSSESTSGSPTASNHAQCTARSDATASDKTVDGGFDDDGFTEEFLSL
jgi:hypothetical protein